MGRASLAPGDDTTLIVPVPGMLAAGIYTVNWRAVSADGHATHGTYTFSVRR
jgi:methionine-rich copper-binding protein CopC